MDFHSLARRELQALCKKNKIPANLTNVAMADALQSLEFVDGIEEVLKTCESDVANPSMESPGKSEALASVPRTGRRTTQRKTIKHDSETLQTTTRSHCRTRGTVVRDVDEAKNDMLETPALPTTRRRAATTSVRAKLESAMKECEPKVEIVDPVEEEKKDVPKTPAAALTSQRKEVKAKSSVRQVYSTRRSVRLAGKPMQESSTQEDEKSGTLTFDAVSEETDESLEVNSDLQSAHKSEELDKNGIDLKSSKSLDMKNKSDTVSVQDSNTLVQNKIDMEDGVQQDSANDLEVVVLDTKAKEGSEEVALGCNNDGSGEEPMEESEIVAEAKEEIDFQNKSQNLGDDPKSNSDITKQPNRQDEPHGDTSDFMAENDGEEEGHFDSDVAGKQELIGEQPVAVSVNPDTNIDFHEVDLFEQSNGEEEAKMRASQQKCVTNMQANIDFLEVNLFEQFNGEVQAKVSGSQQKCLTNMEDAGEVAGEEEPMEEYDVDCTEATMDAPADALEVAGEEEQPMEEFDVDCSEANVVAPADALEVAGDDESMDDSEIDYAEATVESAAHSLPPLPLISNAAPEPVITLALDTMQNPSALTSTNSELITQTPVENSSAVTSIGQMLVTDNKENLVCTKENKGTAGNNLQNLSLRKLTKMLKDLKISKDPSGKEAVNSRSALQKVPENRLTSENEN
ncbi:high mobility group nucleosome-binding domain-containing protein 5-like [Solanum tuberosum]|uniref:Uncharacterized protein n=1 Tax=Solanum tuberosum TaxID=4113 RepID=M1CK55_SOLTU|nr:PREDICTED: high mobility group nucleosome-binding domain-containing protein 5-like [Solanum tuberosum]